jgi:hypothetical protein
LPNLAWTEHPHQQSCGVGSSQEDGPGFPISSSISLAPTITKAI